MIDSLPAAPDPATDVPAVFNAKAAAFVLAQKAMVDQINATTANLNSIAMGGGFAIPYIFNPDDLTKVDGRISLNDPNSQSTTSNLFVNRVSTNGINYSAVLNEFGASTSLIKGYGRVVKQGDPTKFLIFAVTSVTGFDRYAQLAGAVILASQTNPFSAGDAVLLSFTRTGDKGETGTYPQMLARDQIGSGGAAQSLTAGWNARRFNTVIKNDITGLSLSNNVFTFANAGIFRFNASAPGYGVGGHNLRLFDVGRNAASDLGGNEYAPNATTSVGSRATLNTVFSLAAGTQLRLDHYINTAGSSGTPGGTPVSNGSAEIYSEIFITKLS